MRNEALTKKRALVEKYKKRRPLSKAAQMGKGSYVPPGRYSGIRRKTARTPLNIAYAKEVENIAKLYRRPIKSFLRSFTSGSLNIAYAKEVENIAKLYRRPIKSFLRSFTSGSLRKTWIVDIGVDSDGAYLGVYNTQVVKSRWYVFGTTPHIIMGNPLLSFKMGKRVVVTPIVAHPGVRSKDKAYTAIISKYIKRFESDILKMESQLEKIYVDEALKRLR